LAAAIRNLAEILADPVRLQIMGYKFGKPPSGV
jgi:hypothetical protein